MIEKLSVAQRGLRNLGLHGVDLSIASLNVLVGDGSDDRHESPQPVPQRHIGGSDGTTVSGSKGTLPPLLRTGGRHNNPLLGSFPPPASLKKHEATTYAEPSRVANITMTTTEVMNGASAALPPIRAVEDVYLASSPPTSGGPDTTVHRAMPTAVDPGRASGSPATQLDSVVGVPVTPRDDPRRAHKAAAAAISVSTPLQPLRAPLAPQQRPVVHTNKPVHVAAAARNGTPSLIGGVVRNGTPSLVGASTPLANGNGSMASSVRSNNTTLVPCRLGLPLESMNCLTALKRRQRRQLRGLLGLLSLLAARTNPEGSSFCFRK
ncbi:Hypothetical protein, putative [Bodo saltans]|uniref:Uncharacterized protein n=1 Tax=Bodo saltans TaxID=75058 RepID=A0A0S4IKP4_BODSA|nr:Hypothetical protein, putative [Bodo saltans]|eukprot:CUE66994.1 Hypothetical protein, putative [Bodo saltans]